MQPLAVASRYRPPAHTPPRLPCPPAGACKQGVRDRSQPPAPPPCCTQRRRQRRRRPTADPACSAHARTTAHSLSSAVLCASSGSTATALTAVWRLGGRRRCDRRGGAPSAAPPRANSRLAQLQAGGAAVWRASAGSWPLLLPNWRSNRLQAGCWHHGCVPLRWGARGWRRRGSRSRPCGNRSRPLRSPVSWHPAPCHLCCRAGPRLHPCRGQARGTCRSRRLELRRQQALAAAQAAAAAGATARKLAKLRSALRPPGTAHPAIPAPYLPGRPPGARRTGKAHTTRRRGDHPARRPLLPHTRAAAARSDSGDAGPPETGNAARGGAGPPGGPPWRSPGLPPSAAARPPCPTCARHAPGGRGRVRQLGLP